MRGLGIDAEDALDPAMVRFVTRPAEMIDSDLVVLPGSRTAVSDLMWLRERGFAEALASQDDRALYVALGRHPVSGLVRTVQAR